MGGSLTIITRSFYIDSSPENREMISDIPYQNVNSNLYQNWLERKKNEDYRYNFEDKEI